MQNRRQWIVALLFVAGCLLLGPILKNWLYFTTYRLFAEDRAAPASQDGMVWQQFNILGKRVIPQILTEGAARLRFPIAFPKSSLLLFTATAAGPATFEINLLENGSRRLLSEHAVEGQETESIAIPPCNGILEITSQGSIVWSDLRIDHGWPVMPLVVALGILLLASAVLRTVWLKKGGVTSEPGGRGKVPLFIAVSIVGSFLLAIVLIEISLQAAGAPPAIRTLRRELGEVSPDPQWEDSVRYGSRLRRNQNTILEWKDGDIVRMGFIPPSPVSSAPPGRYSLRTDSEGFRNMKVREAPGVATLGDSFTDGLTLPVEQIWSNLLEQNLKVPVQNYGTAGFGPQQELRVLTEYAIRHHPHVVLLAFFAGNDIFNAESFEQYEKAAGSITLPTTGWRIKKVVARYETLYCFSLLRFTLDALKARFAGKTPGRPTAANTPDSNAQTSGAGSASLPDFDRGMFTIPTNGHSLRFALMPPYLQTLMFSQTDLENRSGWQLTRKTIIEMNRVARDGGAKLVVLFIPFKSQVYLPLLERSFSAEALKQDFEFYFRQAPARLDLNEMSHNRLAQNRLMRRLCDEEGILMIDPTEGLQAEVDSGRNMYFPDDAHWNAAGHEFAANAVAAFLRSHELVQNKE